MHPIDQSVTLTGAHNWPKQHQQPENGRSLKLRRTTWTQFGSIIALSFMSETAGRCCNLVNGKPPKEISGSSNSKKRSKSTRVLWSNDVWWNITLFFTSTYHWNKWTAYEWLISRNKQAQGLQKDLATTKSSCSKTVKHIQLGDYGCYWVQIKLADFGGHICKQHKIFNHHT